MKKIMIIIVIQIIVLSAFGGEANVATTLFHQIYLNQTNYKRPVTKEEKDNLRRENERRKGILRKLENELTEMAKTNNAVKEAIINEMIAHSEKGIPSNRDNHSIMEFSYRISLFSCLYKLGAHTMLECSNRLIDLGLYSDMFNFVRFLRNYWIRGELTAEEIKPIVIACADKKITSAAEVLLGLNMGKITRPLDKTLGEKYVREWINETTDENIRMQYYRMLNRAGIKELDYIDLIVKRIEDTKDSPTFSAGIAKELVEIGATNKPEIEKLVKNVNVKKEKFLKELDEQEKKQKKLKKNYNPTNVLEFYEKQLEFVNNNNIVYTTEFIERLPEFEQQYNITGIVNLSILEGQEKFLKSSSMKSCYETNIVKHLEKQLEYLRKYPNPFKEIEKAKKF